MVGGIGGGGPVGPGKVGGASAPTGSPEASAPSSKNFGEVVRGPEGSTAASPLERLRTGEIDLRGYVDLRVREATSHLAGVLGPSDLARVRDELQEVIELDPDVAALVKAAEVGR